MHVVPAAEKRRSCFYDIVLGVPDSPGDPASVPAGVPRFTPKWRAWKLRRHLRDRLSDVGFYEAVCMQG